MTHRRHIAFRLQVSPLGRRLRQPLGTSRPFAFFIAIGRRSADVPVRNCPAIRSPVRTTFCILKLQSNLIPSRAFDPCIGCMRGPPVRGRPRPQLPRNTLSRSLYILHSEAAKQSRSKPRLRSCIGCMRGPPVRGRPRPHLPRNTFSRSLYILHSETAKQSRSKPRLRSCIGCMRGPRTKSAQRFSQLTIVRVTSSDASCWTK